MILVVDWAQCIDIEKNFSPNKIHIFTKARWYVAERGNDPRAQVILNEERRELRKNVNLDDTRQQNRYSHLFLV
jgi:hypothetical protein